MVGQRLLTLVKMTTQNEAVTMDITSAAGFLIRTAVRTASGLQQQQKDASERSILKPIREKPSDRLTENKRRPMGSSAYRVTISSAAMQKMSVGNTATAA